MVKDEAEQKESFSTNKKGYNKNGENGWKQSNRNLCLKRFFFCFQQRETF